MLRAHLFLGVWCGVGNGNEQQCGFTYELAEGGELGGSRDIQTVTTHAQTRAEAAQQMCFVGALLENSCTRAQACPILLRPVAVHRPHSEGQP